MKSLGLYIHWPFCLSKCPYCDFNSHIREKIDQKRWKAALLQELVSAAAHQQDHELVSIFFGGGTPSLMDPDTVGALLETAKSLFNTKENIEITLEANPNTVEASRFKAYFDAGINRLSLGIQSIDDASLAFLGRRHSAKDALKALDIAATYFPRFSFDLIYARPNQTPESWKDELLTALSFAKDHMSLYQLTIEPQTAFATRLARGEKMALEDNPAATLYELTEELMQTAGLPAYEISNYAKPSQECRHNLLYWNFDDYLGIGPGAHGRISSHKSKWSTTRYKAPEMWIEAVESQGHGLQLTQELSTYEKLQELTLMGMRLTKGLEIKRIFEETELELEQAYNPSNLIFLQKEGLLNRSETHLSASLEGRLRLNSLISFLFN